MDSIKKFLLQTGWSCEDLINKANEFKLLNQIQENEDQQEFDEIEDRNREINQQGNLQDNENENSTQSTTKNFKNKVGEVSKSKTEDTNEEIIEIEEEIIDLTQLSPNKRKKQVDLTQLNLSKKDTKEDFAYIIIEDEDEEQITKETQKICPQTSTKLTKTEDLTQLNNQKHIREEKLETEEDFKGDIISTKVGKQIGDEIDKISAEKGLKIEEIHNIRQTKPINEEKIQTEESFQCDNVIVDDGKQIEGGMQKISLKEDLIMKEIDDLSQTKAVKEDTQQICPKESCKPKEIENFIEHKLIKEEEIENGDSSKGNIITIEDGKQNKGIIQKIYLKKDSKINKIDDLSQLIQIKEEEMEIEESSQSDIITFKDGKQIQGKIQKVCLKQDSKIDKIDDLSQSIQIKEERMEIEESPQSDSITIEDGKQIQGEIQKVCLKQDSKMKEIDDLSQSIQIKEEEMEIEENFSRQNLPGKVYEQIESGKQKNYPKESSKSKEIEDLSKQPPIEESQMTTTPNEESLKCDSITIEDRNSNKGQIQKIFPSERSQKNEIEDLTQSNQIKKEEIELEESPKCDTIKIVLDKQFKGQIQRIYSKESLKSKEIEDISKQTPIKEDKIESEESFQCDMITIEDKNPNKDKDQEISPKGDSKQIEIDTLSQSIEIKEEEIEIEENWIHDSVTIEDCKHDEKQNKDEMQKLSSNEGSKQNVIEDISIQMNEEKMEIEHSKSNIRFEDTNQINDEAQKIYPKRDSKFNETKKFSNQTQSNQIEEKGIKIEESSKSNIIINEDGKQNKSQIKKISSKRGLKRKKTGGLTQQTQIKKKKLEYIKENKEKNQEEIEVKNFTQPIQITEEKNVIFILSDSIADINIDETKEVCLKEGSKIEVQSLTELKPTQKEEIKFQEFGLFSTSKSVTDEKEKSKNKIHPKEKMEILKRMEENFRYDNVTNEDEDLSDENVEDLNENEESLRSDDENINESEEESNNENVYENQGRNKNENINENKEIFSVENLTENEESLRSDDQNIDENEEENKNENEEENKNENVYENQEENRSENIDENKEENIDENKEENIDVNKEGNKAENTNETQRIYLKERLKSKEIKILNKSYLIGGELRRNEENLKHVDISNETERQIRNKTQKISQKEHLKLKDSENLTNLKKIEEKKKKNEENFTLDDISNEPEEKIRDKTQNVSQKEHFKLKKIKGFIQLDKTEEGKKKSEENVTVKDISNETKDKIRDKSQKISQKEHLKFKNVENFAQLENIEEEKKKNQENFAHKDISNETKDKIREKTQTISQKGSLKLKDIESFTNINQTKEEKKKNEENFTLDDTTNELEEKNRDKTQKICQRQSLKLKNVEDFTHLNKIEEKKKRNQENFILEDVSKETEKQIVDKTQKISQKEHLKLKRSENFSNLNKIEEEKNKNAENFTLDDILNKPEEKIRDKSQKIFQKESLKLKDIEKTFELNKIEVEKQKNEENFSLKDFSNETKEKNRGNTQKISQKEGLKLKDIEKILELKETDEENNKNEEDFKFDDILNEPKEEIRDKTQKISQKDHLKLQDSEHSTNLNKTKEGNQKNEENFTLTDISNETKDKIRDKTQKISENESLRSLILKNFSQLENIEEEMQKNEESFKCENITDENKEVFSDEIENILFITSMCPKESLKQKEIENYEDEKLKIKGNKEENQPKHSLKGLYQNLDLEIFSIHKIKSNENENKEIKENLNCDDISSNQFEEIKNNKQGDIQIKVFKPKNTKTKKLKGKQKDKQKNFKIQFKKKHEIILKGKNAYEKKFSNELSDHTYTLNVKPKRIRIETNHFIEKFPHFRSISISRRSNLLFKTRRFRRHLTKQNRIDRKRLIAQYKCADVVRSQIIEQLQLLRSRKSQLPLDVKERITEDKIISKKRYSGEKCSTILNELMELTENQNVEIESNILENQCDIIIENDFEMFDLSNNLNESNLNGSSLNESDLNEGNFNESNLNGNNLNGSHLNRSNLNESITETIKNKIGNFDENIEPIPGTSFSHFSHLEPKENLNTNNKNEKNISMDEDDSIGNGLKNIMIVDVRGGCEIIPDNKENNFEDNYMIKPTKTNDITKIKGWKNKRFNVPNISNAFSSSNLDGFLEEANLHISFKIPTLESGKLKIEEKINERINENEISQTQIIKDPDSMNLYRPRTLLQKKRIMKLKYDGKKKNGQKPRTLAEKRKLMGNELLNNMLSKVIKRKSHQFNHSYVLYRGKRLKVVTKTQNDIIAYIKAISTKPLSYMFVPKKYRGVKTKPSIFKNTYSPTDQILHYRPGPLCKKVNLQYDNCNWKTIIKKLPKVKLTVIPEFKKPLDPYVQYLLPKYDFEITPDRLEFALMALKPTKKEITCFEFEVPFKNNQQEILLRKKMDDTFSKVDTKPDEEKSTEDICKNVIENMLNYLEVKEISDDVIKNDINIFLNEEIEDKEINLEKNKPQGIKRKKSNKTNYELKRLNVKVIEVNLEEKEEIKNCQKEFCRLGCICHSLSTTSSLISNHCGRFECMFECICNYKRNSKGNVKVTLPIGTDLLSEGAVNRLEGEAKKNLAKVEKEFTQTVIQANNQTIVVGGCSNRQRRVAKFPKKYADYLENDEYFSPFIQRNENIEEPEKEYQLKNYSVSLTKVDLSQIIPFCLTHNLYDCFCKCQSEYIPGEESDVEIINDIQDFYIPYKEMEIKRIRKPSPKVLSITDSCSRAKGIPTNYYLARNRTNTFITMRNRKFIRNMNKYLLKHDMDEEKRVFYTNESVSVDVVRSPEELINQSQEVKTPTMEKSRRKQELVVRDEDNMVIIKTTQDPTTNEFKSHLSKKNPKPKCKIMETTLTTDGIVITKRTLTSNYNMESTSNRYTSILKKSFDNNSDNKSEHKFHKKSNNKSDNKSNNKSDNQSNYKSDNQSNYKSDNQSNNKSENQSNNKSDNQSNNKSDNKSNNKSDNQSNNKSDNQSNNTSENKSIDTSTNTSINNQSFCKILPKPITITDILMEKFKKIFPLVQENVHYFLPSPEVSLQFANMLGKKTNPNTTFCLLNWQIFSTYFWLKKISVWFSTYFATPKIIITELNDVPKHFVNVRYFATNEHVHKNEIIKALITNTVPGIVRGSNDEVQVILELNRLFCYVHGTMKKNTNKTQQHTISSNKTPKIIQAPTLFEKTDTNEKEKRLNSPIVRKILFSKTRCQEYNYTTVDKDEENILPTSVKARLPAVKSSALWRMIKLNSDFSILTLEKSDYRIKYADLQKVLKMADETSLTIAIRTDQGLPGNRSHKEFGIYASPNCPYSVFVGPYLQNENHDISLLRYLNRELIPTNLFNKMKGLPPTTIGVWIQRDKDPGSAKSLTIDLTESDHEGNEDNEGNKKGDRIVTRKYLDSLEADCEDYHCTHENCWEVDINNFNLSTLKTVYFCTNVPSLGYFVGHGNGKLTLLRYPSENITLKFRNDFEAIEFLEKEISSSFILAPEFKLRIVVRVKTTEGQSAFNPDLLKGYYIINDKGVFNVLDLTSTKLEELKMTEPYLRKELDLRASKIIYDQCLETVKGCTRFVKWRKTSELLTWMRKEIQKLKSMEEEQKVELKAAQITRPFILERFQKIFQELAPKVNEKFKTKMEDVIKQQGISNDDLNPSDSNEVICVDVESPSCQKTQSNLPIYTKNPDMIITATSSLKEKPNMKVPKLVIKDLKTLKEIEVAESNKKDADEKIDEKNLESNKDLNKVNENEKKSDVKSDKVFKYIWKTAKGKVLEIGPEQYEMMRASKLKTLQPPVVTQGNVIQLRNSLNIPAKSNVGQDSIPSQISTVQLKDITIPENLPPGFVKLTIKTPLKTTQETKTKDNG